MNVIQVPSQPLSSTAAFFNITTRVRSVPGQAAQAVIAVRPPHTVHMLSPVGNVIYVCMYVCMYVARAGFSQQYRVLLLM